MPRFRLKIDPDPVKEAIVGRHPTTGVVHRLSLDVKDKLTIVRDDLVTKNPVTGAEERQSFQTITEPFKLHKWLWDTIKSNPLTP